MLLRSHDYGPYGPSRAIRTWNSLKLDLYQVRSYNLARTASYALLLLPSLALDLQSNYLLLSWLSATPVYATGKGDHQGASRLSSPQSR